MNINKFKVKEDCFAYNSIKKECIGLDKLYCKREKCKFYRSKEDNVIAAKKASDNIGGETFLKYNYIKLKNNIDK